MSTLLTLCFPSPSVTQLHDLIASSDAAGAAGFGAVWGSRWFYGSCQFLPRSFSTAFLELLPIVVAGHLWGHAWFRLRVQFVCDNSGIVSALNSGTSRSSDAMHLLRFLTRDACRFNFAFSALHTPGARNADADALSRFNLQEFRRLVPDANPLPFSIPPPLLASLVPPT